MNRLYLVILRMFAILFTFFNEHIGA